MFITSIVNTTVLSIGNLNIRFNNDFLEIVNRDIYPNPVYTIPEMRITEIGIVDVLGEGYLVVKTTLPIPHHLQLFPCSEHGDIDYEKLKVIFKCLPFGFGKEMEKGYIPIGFEVSLSRQGFRVRGGEEYGYDDVRSFMRKEREIVIELVTGVKTIKFDRYKDARTFEILFNRLLRNKVMIDEAYFKQHVIGSLSAGSHDIFYYAGLLSIYDNALGELHIENDQVSNLELITEESGSCSCTLRVTSNDSTVKEIIAFIPVDITGLTPHKAKTLCIIEEEKVFMEIKKLIWAIHRP